MRIEKLDESTKKNLLEDLLKRSPNNYGKYESSVREILDAVKEKGTKRYFHIQRSLTEQRSMRRMCSSQTRR